MYGTLQMASMLDLNQWRHKSNRTPPSSSPQSLVCTQLFVSNVKLRGAEGWGLRRRSDAGRGGSSRQEGARRDGRRLAAMNWNFGNLVLCLHWTLLCGLKLSRSWGVCARFATRRLQSWLASLPYRFSSCVYQMFQGFMFRSSRLRSHIIVSRERLHRHKLYESVNRFGLFYRCLKTAVIS